MLRSRDLRKRAWEALRPSYWNAFIVCLIAGLLGGGASVGAGFSSGFNFSLNSGSIEETVPEFDSVEELMASDAFGMLIVVLLGIFAVVSVISLLWALFVTNPVNIGCCGFFTQNAMGNSLIANMFRGFQYSYARNVITMFLVGLKTYLWSLLFVIPGIIKAYEYAMVPYILAEDPNVTTANAFAWSKALMKGNKFRLFKLQFSFIGWHFLCLFTLGIGELFLTPYIQAATAEFYVQVSRRNY